MIQFGFVSNGCDHPLFVYNHHNIELYALIYVDDILIIGSSFKLIHALIHKLHDKFALKRLGTPQYFLGIEVHHQANDTLLLTQTKYIRDLISNANINEVKGVDTPMFSQFKLRNHGTDVIPYPLLCRSTNGVL